MSRDRSLGELSARVRWRAGRWRSSKRRGSGLGAAVGVGVSAEGRARRVEGGGRTRSAPTLGRSWRGWSPSVTPRRKEGAVWEARPVRGLSGMPSTSPTHHRCRNLASRRQRQTSEEVNHLAAQLIPPLTPRRDPAPPQSPVDIRKFRLTFESPSVVAGKATSPPPRLARCMHLAHQVSSPSSSSVNRSTPLPPTSRASHAPRSRPRLSLPREWLKRGCRGRRRASMDWTD